MKILGVSCYYHDSAAALICDGEIIAAAQEERFNRIKNYPMLPIRAINYCLQQADISIFDVDCMVFYERPFLKFARVVVNHLRAYPFSLWNFMATTPAWLENRLIMPLVFKKELGYAGKAYFFNHHISHAASSFFLSPFDRSAFFTSDGIGEWGTVCMGSAEGVDVNPVCELRYPHSLGLIYTAITTYLGFNALSGEGKVMGLAAYGSPGYLDGLKEIIYVRPDGSFKIDKRYFGFNRGKRMYSGKFIKKFGPPRQPGSKITERHKDMATSLQALLEEILIKMALYLHKEVKSENLCLAGGVFLNCIANGKILKETPFERVFIQPAAGDSGGALGAAAAAYCRLAGKRPAPMRHAYLGPSFNERDCKRAFSAAGLDFRQYDEKELLTRTASLLADGKIVGWFQGRMEFGPRALGNRSILASPVIADMKDRLNTRVKNREPFRPYAPSVLEEYAREYFDLAADSPYMLLAANVRADKRKEIPAVTHVDGTARIQTVSQKTNPKYYDLINEFYKITATPMILNTSFNVRGEPIVCTPDEALNCFINTDMDAVVINNCLAVKA